MTDPKHRDRLITLLKELFQLDKPELDFGLYKIMHARAERVTQFLEHDLLAEIEAAFGEADDNRIAEAKATYEAKRAEAESLGAPDPDAAPAVKEAKAKYEAAKDGGNSETEIYDHLYRFFERYYDKGDFMSRRYYARESDSRAAPYAVPYDGREVYLHWVNKDQYYIKSSEYLSNYSFDLNEAVRQLAKEHKGSEGLDFDPADDTPLKVHFRIVDGSEGEHGNVKEADSDKRQFVPFAGRPAEVNEQAELVLNFQYKALPGGQYSFDEAAIRQQYGNLNKGDLPHYWMANTFLDAIDALTGLPTAYGQQLRALAPTDKQKKRPLLVKYLNKYTSRNTMDYFIHKDLGGFLRRELDFYIKNEIMQLDAIEQADAPQVEQYLAKIKVLRRIAHQLIDFLAQLENFQKKLWLKKKFVTETNYGITLDRVPESLYEDVAANDAQRQEWCELFHIQDSSLSKNRGDLHNPAYSEPLTVEFLKANPFLMLDTKHFDDDFKARLINEIDDFDEQCDGVLVHSENFQALNLSKNKNRKNIDFIYIDPPYNTVHSKIAYKNQFEHSSWLSLITNTLPFTKDFFGNSYSFGFAIDDYEYNNAFMCLKGHFLNCDISTIVINQHPQGSGGRLSRTHEYYIVVSPADGPQYLGAPKVDEVESRSFMRSGTAENNYRWGRWKSFYALLVDPKNNEIVSVEHPPELGTSYPTDKTDSGLVRVYPINSTGEERVWRSSYETGKWRVTNGELYVSDRGAIKQLVDHQDKRQTLFSNWVGTDYNAGVNGTAVLDDLGLGNDFDYPKSVPTLEQSFWMQSFGKRSYTVLDYFAGSGTTAHATLSMTRKDKHQRKYVLVEQGNYFDTVLKPRIAKVVYSENWKNGKPVPTTENRKRNTESSFNGISHCFKYIRLESYEDALNNLVLRDDASRDRAIDNNANLRRDYLLNYFLDVETQGSQSLLNVGDFRDPTAYSMRIKQPGSDETREQAIDLVETFNWLIGLWVEHLAAPQTFAGEFKREKDPQLPDDENTRLVCTRLKRDQQGDYWFRLVEGYTLKVPGDKQSKSPTLVIWRKLTDDAERDNAALQEYLRVIGVSTREHVYDTIYVNGSHTLPNPVVDGENTKVRLLEDAFHHAMWAEA